MTYAIKDSGERQTFTSGMTRDTVGDKPDIELIFNGPMADRWAAHLTKGAKKYPDVRPGVPNWTLADGEAELIRFRKSAVRHFRQWLRGETDEDHAAAVFFNLNGYEFVKAKRPMSAGEYKEYVDEKAKEMVSTTLSDISLKQESKGLYGGEPAQSTPPWKCPDCGKEEPNLDRPRRCGPRLRVAS